MKDKSPVLIGTKQHLNWMWMAHKRISQWEEKKHAAQEDIRARIKKNILAAIKDPDVRKFLELTIEKGGLGWNETTYDLLTYLIKESLDFDLTQRTIHSVEKTLFVFFHTAEIAGLPIYSGLEIDELCKKVTAASNGMIVIRFEKIEDWDNKEVLQFKAIIVLK